MPVTPLGIYSPDGTDGYDLTVDLAAMATSIDGAIGNIGAWTAYTPTWAGFSETGATIGGYYLRVGDLVHGFARITAGTAAPVSGAVSFSLPVTASASGGPNSEFSYSGTGACRDVSAALSTPAFASYNSSTSMVVRVSDNSTTYGRYASLSSTAPFTWTTGDILEIRFTYPAA